MPIASTLVYILFLYIIVLLYEVIVITIKHNNKNIPPSIANCK